MRILCAILFLSSTFLITTINIYSLENISQAIQFYKEDVNSVIIIHGNQTIAVYGTPPGYTEQNLSVDSVLFTHHRRDVVWAGLRALADGSKAIVPEGGKIYFSDAYQYWSEKQPQTNDTAQANIPINNFHRFWQGFAQSRFHDYAQQTTKIVTKPINVFRTVKEGDVIDVDGLPIHVMETPGYTRGSVSYIMKDKVSKEVNRNYKDYEVTVAFTGDLIYGDGKILDLYSLQDEIPEANLRGYHGYAARIADVIQSLDKVMAAEPDIIVPARGPLIKNPKEAVEKLKKRLRDVYRNYLSTSALLWYFGKEHIQICADRVLGEGETITPVAWAETINENAPSWVKDINTSRILVSETKEALLIDCGYQSVIDYMKQMIKDGEIHAVSAIYVTHYHNDHTDMVAAAAQEFGCPVYSHAVMEDILEYPGAYRMPAATDAAVENAIAFAEGESLQWNEFTLTFYDYPGQAYYHSGLHVQKDGGECILFVGDSFTPSGMDDYCLLNRNLIHPDTGYFKCLDFLTKIDPKTLLINEHVKQPFRFSAQQIKDLQKAYQERHDLLAELFPWDDPNYGIDEGWARFYPYGQDVSANQNVTVFLNVYNHSPVEKRFEAALNPPDGWTCEQAEVGVNIPARTQQKVQFTLQPVDSPTSGVHVITADIAFGDWKLHEWTEALLFVK